MLMDEACLAAKVRRVHRIVVRHYDHALRESGVTVAQLDILATILELRDNVKPATLGRELLMDRSTVSRNVRRLEDLGLVKVANGPNGRDQILRLTSKGRRTADQAYVPWSAAQTELKKRLGSEGVAALDLLVEKLGRRT
jgi:DNA-binding MarR family transcriptional regulator